MADVTAGDASRFVQHFAAASYGDALLGSALALLLRPDAPPAVQVGARRLLVSSLAKTS